MDELFDEIDLGETSSISVGIDLGTVNSEVVKCNGKNDYTYLLDNGSQMVKSAIFFDEEETYFYGKKAENLGIRYPRSLLRCFKRGLSSSSEAFMNEKGEYVIQYAYHSKPELQNNQEVILAPKSAISIFLGNLISKMNNQLKEEEVKNLVLTVPAKFSPAICKALRQAALVHTDSVSIVTEPVAAALYYDFEIEKLPNNSYILVYDLGGGTFDISLLKKNNNGTLEYIDTDGDVRLGGEDFTNKLVELAKDQLFNDYDIDLYTNYDDNEYYHNLGVLRQRCNELKEALSQNNVASTNFKLQFDGEANVYDWSVSIDTFQQMILPLINRTLDKIKLILRRNELSTNDIHKVILVGGGSFIPLVQQKIKETFHCGIYMNDCTYMISKGASIIARQLFEEKNEENKELFEAINFSGIVKMNADTIGYTLGSERRVSELIPRHSQVPFDTTIKFNVDDAMFNDEMIINFYSYDPYETNDPHSFDDEVDHFGCYSLLNGFSYPGSATVSASVTLNEDYILRLHITIKDGTTVLQDIEDIEITGGI